MKNPFKKFYHLALSAKTPEDDDKALLELEKIEHTNVLIPPHILVFKGICIQRSSENQPYSLEDVKVAYKKAIEIDENCIDALFELACFYNVYEDNPSKAAKYYKKAFDLAKYQYLEIVKEYAKCLAETESVSKACAFINKCRKETFDESDVKETIDDLFNINE